jgi:hypothetical protein
VARAAGFVIAKLAEAQEHSLRAADEVIGTRLKIDSLSHDEGDFEGSELERRLRASAGRLLAESRTLDVLIRDAAALIPDPEEETSEDPDA